MCKYLFLLSLLCILSCSMPLKMPDNYTVINGGRSCLPPYGMCNLAKRIVIINDPIPITNKDEYVISEHEKGHIWGIKECGRQCCLMYESRRIYEILAKPLQLFYGFNFCDNCIKYLQKKGALIE